MDVETVHIVQRLAPGGIETLVLDLARDTHSRIGILSLEGSRGDLIRAWPALAPVADRIEAFDAGAGLKPALVARLMQTLRRIGPRAVVLHHVGPLIYGGLAARLAGVPRIVHVEHDVWHYGQNARRTSLTALIERLVKPHHVAVSEQGAATLRAMLKGAAISVIHNGIDLERFRPGDKAAARARFGLDANRRVVGTAGRMVAVKGHDVFIRAASHLPDDCDVAIAGSGEERPRLEKLASDLGIAHRVRFLGHVDRVEDVLPAFDVFCLPSHAEGFPRSVIEAQAAGIPVVATDVGALAEAVCPLTGRITPAGDPAALSAALREALAAPRTASPRDFVSARFSWQRTVDAYRQVVELPHVA